MTRGPLERKEFQMTFDGEMLLFYPAPYAMFSEWDRKPGRSESINEDVGR